MFIFNIVLIRRTCPGLHENILTPIKALSSKKDWPIIFADDLVIFDSRIICRMICESMLSTKMQKVLQHCCLGEPDCLAG